MENSYIRELEAEVTEKKFRDNKYYIKLNRTIFYPHLAGGQPRDLGTINDVEVIDVYEEGEEIVHVLKDNISGTKVKLSIDWENRMDLMQQHTGQHLLSAVIYKLYNGETSSLHMSNDYSQIDIDLPEFTNEDIEKIELLANRIIYSNFKIKTYFVNKNELENIPFRKKPSVNSNIRIVEIDGFDYSPCGGTHLSSTGEIGIIKIRRWDKKRRNVRIEFVCGNRALHDYSWKNTYVRELSVLLSSKEKDVLSSVKRLYDAKEELDKENRDLRESIYQLKGETFLKDVKYSNGIGFIYKTLEDMDFKELNLIANYLNTKEYLIQVYGLYNGKKTQLYVSKTKDIDIDLSEIFKNLTEKYEIKGGGNSNTIQGGVKTDELETIMKDFTNIIIKKLKVRIP